MTEDNQNGKWRLGWGIHRGTIMSRDIGQPKTFDSREEAVKAVEELKRDFAKMGYVLWFATLTSPDGQEEQLGLQQRPLGSVAWFPSAVEILPPGTLVIRYRDLPISPASNVHLECSDECDGGEYSAARGDYFQCPDDGVVKCECGAAMVLIRVRVTYEEITPAEAGRT
jgi:hypothetical protein